ncbi:restriction endonuclease-related protein [Acrocarpospora catenulata]|uniref:restriction endonuclease-related protein n=1 Tax=Acrocarpospora catenulata TaxID=2836182 RepID=UPI001BDAB067|nr:hypothetical protein [Acrocarpospora catenulata]
MTAWLAPPSGELSERRRRVVTAALRAAYAWTVRETRPKRAMHEIARMTGVIMEAQGPGRAPNTPLDLVRALRIPLNKLPIFADSDDPVGQMSLLADENELSPDVQDLICEYVMPLNVLTDSGSWLPDWTRMRSDQIRHQVFTAMTAMKKQEVYVASRRLLIEHPAGVAGEIGDLVSKAEIRVASSYQPIPRRQLHRTETGKAWWWPCPDCRWPMMVSRGGVRCGYRPHSYVYEVTKARANGRPTLRRIDESSGPRKPPETRAAEDAVCLDMGVWRFIVVPGSSELRIYKQLQRLGARVDLWPDFDSYDLYVTAGDHEFTVDVKEYRSTHRLISDLKAKPPRARVLLPKTHEHQHETLRAALPSLSVTTEKRFLAQVRRALQTSGRSE